MPNPLQQINELIPELPSKDIDYAKKFIAKRDWESLKDLTWSAMKRIETALKRENSHKYDNIDIDKVRELALLCNEYYYLIYPEDLEPKEDDFDDGEDF